MGVPEKFLEDRNHVSLIAYSLSDSLLYTAWHRARHYQDLL